VISGHTTGLPSWYGMVGQGRIGSGKGLGKLSRYCSVVGGRAAKAEDGIGTTGTGQGSQ